MMLKSLALAGAALISLGTAGAQTANTITDSFHLSASAFNDVHTPNPFVQGDFTVTFNNSGDVAPTASGLTVSNFTLSGFESLFTYVASTDTLYFGHVDTDNGTQCSVSSYANQYCLTITHASSATPMAALNDPFFYNTSDSNGPYFANAVAITPQVAAAVPELATWVMFIGGLGAIGVAMRRRRHRFSFA